MLRLKNILTLGIFGFVLNIFAQQPYSEWVRQQNKIYMSWRSEQDWHKKYFVWKNQTDNEFGQWKKQNKWEDVEDPNWINQNPFDEPFASDFRSNAKNKKQKSTLLKKEREHDFNNVYADNKRKERKINAKQNNKVNNIVLSEIKIWAVIVGVAHYKNPKSRLNYADDDAYKMYGFLKSPSGGALPEDRISILVDEDATGNNIRESLKTFSKKAGSDDILLFYFSGHGIPNSLLAEDFDIRDSGILSHKFIRKQFENSRAKNVYCIVDACHSGSFSLKSTLHKNLVLHNTSTKEMESTQPFYDSWKKQKGGIVFILSSKGEETSLEASGKRQGVFTYFLIKGLQGKADYNKDKIVSIPELFDFTRKEVMRYTRNRQTPIITGVYHHTMPIAVVH